MATYTLVETVHGKYHKFEIVKTYGFMGIKFYIRKDGKPYRGPYSSLADAVQAARDEG